MREDTLLGSEYRDVLKVVGLSYDDQIWAYSLSLYRFLQSRDDSNLTRDERVLRRLIAIGLYDNDAFQNSLPMRRAMMHSVAMAERLWEMSRAEWDRVELIVSGVTLSLLTNRSSRVTAWSESWERLRLPSLSIRSKSAFKLPTYPHRPVRCSASRTPTLAIVVVHRNIHIIIYSKKAQTKHHLTRKPTPYKKQPNYPKHPPTQTHTSNYESEWVRPGPTRWDWQNVSDQGEYSEYDGNLWNGTEPSGMWWNVMECDGMWQNVTEGSRIWQNNLKVCDGT